MVWVLGGIDAITQNYARHGLIMPCFEFWGLDCLKNITYLGIET